MSTLLASIHDLEFIVFCGVHFMAEFADILARSHQKVMLPHLHTGCPMADMATVGAVVMVQNLVQAVIVTGEAALVPVFYVNSSAAIKAFVGERRGSVCTPLNVERVLAWALAYPRIRFVVSGEGGNSLVETVLSSCGMPRSCSGMVIVESIAFLAGSRAQMAPAGARHPDYGIHPECAGDVVQIADQYGSTEDIALAS